MKQSIGIDIEYIARFKKIKKSDTFIKNNFTKQEQDYCFTKTQPATHMAAIYAAKEAVRKTIAKSYAPLNEIEIVHTQTGKPSVRLHKKKYGDLSISHTKDIVVAVVIR